MPTRLGSQVAVQLREWPTYQAARRVLSYLAFGSEIDLWDLHEEGGKTFYVTRTARAQGSDLTIHRLGAGLEPHPYGYLQPPADAEPVSPHIIDLVLVPGLCFDMQGTRLGYGKGYYDRLLPSLQPEVVRVGVTAEALVVPTLPSDSFDVTMTHLVTELGVVAVGRNPASR